jgi:hypothetical protein
LTSREEAGSDPPSTATPALVGAARVQELREARARELRRVQELAKLLAHEEAQAEKLAWAHARAADRFETHMRALVRKDLAGKPVTLPPCAELGRELGLARDLERDLAVKKAQVAAGAQDLARAQSRVEGLERALALAMAQARMLARAQEQASARARARSPRVRAIAIARFLLGLLQARWGLWDGLVRNLYLGMKVVGLVGWMLPAADRARWKNESYNELEELKQEGSPLLGDAIRIALRIPWLALVLWTGTLGRSPAARWLARLKPLWIGLGTAAATFWAGAAGIGQSPTDWQMRSLVAASLLTGVMAAAESDPRRRPRRRRRKRR